MTLDKLTRRAFLRRALFEAPIAAFWLYSSLSDEKAEFRGVDSPETPISKYAPHIVKRADEIVNSGVDEFSNLAKIAEGMGNLIGAEWAIRRDAQFPERDFDAQTLLEKALYNPSKEYKKLKYLVQDVIFPRNRKEHRNIFWVSLGSTLAGRIADNYSTVEVAKLMQDQRFKEYGLDGYFFEINPGMDPYPSPDYLSNPKIAAEEALIIGFSYFCPIKGIGEGMKAPFLYLNNSYIHQVIKTSFDIGDSVKEKLKEGYSARQILGYLRNISPEELRK